VGSAIVARAAGQWQIAIWITDAYRGASASGPGRDGGLLRGPAYTTIHLHSVGYRRRFAVIKMIAADCAIALARAARVTETTGCLSITVIVDDPRAIDDLACTEIAAPRSCRSIVLTHFVEMHCVYSLRLLRWRETETFSARASFRQIAMMIFRAGDT